MSFPVEKRFDHPVLEVEVLDRWQQQRVFERSVEERPEAPSFTFYEGPPTANGRPGIHHVMSRTIKDTFCRYKTLKGFRVSRKAGWDTHGLPVEIEVEKALGLEGRHQVEEFGIERYNRACRENVQQYTELWNQLTRRMGYWVDLNDPYVTFRNEYIETVWWLLKQMFDKDLLYQGYKIQWYSPGTGTVLSSHEVAQGYREVQDPSVYVRFPLVEDENTAFLAWTTTPWTLPSNTALALNKNLGYARVRLADGTHLILAENRLDVLKADYEVVERMKGEALLGMRYHPPFTHFRDEAGADAAWRVIHADFVTDTDGTGVAHEAPAFGADDYSAVVQQEGMPLFNPVNPDGTFSDALPLVAGLDFKAADRPLIRDLKARGLLYREESYLHNYPHDWRKGTPLMMYPVESWFIRTTAYKDRLVALNETINWQPEGIGQGRFGEWLRGNVDWALSRRRFWGTPLPIWKSDASEYYECIGSIDELKAKVGEIPAEALNPDTGELDLHRPYVDALTWPAPDGGTMRRVPDLIDVWFDSGAMPFAQWHYPFENEEKFRDNFPADFIAEGVDQTRGWFYTLHAIATLVMDSVAYKNVVVNGLVLDEKGEKMSKSRGNTVNPFEVIGEHGADVVRWYMMSNAPPWENLRFSERGLQETRHKFFGTLENTYTFFATYANVDAPDFSAPPVPLAARPELDRWILSRMAATVEEVDASYAGYNPTKAARAVEAFVNDLSNWHIRRSRRRFWSSKSGGEGTDERDKLAAYQTVWTCLHTVSVLMSPIAPFFSEWLYRSLTKSVPGAFADSVHLAPFPSADASARDRDLERRMALARTVSSLVLGLRNEAEINVRQPLARVLVVLGPQVRQEDVEAVRAIVLDEVNVRAFEYVDAGSRFVQRSAAPNFRVLGKRLGKAMKVAADRIRAMSDAEVDTFATTGTVTLDVDGTPTDFSGEEIVVTSEGVPGWLVAQEGGVTVALDTTITPELRQEGLAREAVNRIQNLRKSAGLEVTDRVALTYEASSGLAEALLRHADYVRNETLALTLAPGAPQGFVEQFEIGDEHLRIGLERRA